MTKKNWVISGKEFLNATFIAFILVALSACGGGGSDDEPEESVTPVVPETVTGGGETSPDPDVTPSPSEPMQENRAPTLSLGVDKELENGRSYRHDFTVSDPDGDDLEVDVEILENGGGYVRISSRFGVGSDYFRIDLPDFKDGDVRTIRVQVTVTDPGGLSATDEISFMVKPWLTVTEDIYSDTVWGPYQTYLVKNDITIHGGATLEVQPGTKVRFYEDTGLTVKGELHSITLGTDRNSFTKYVSSRLWPWDGIVVEPGGKADMMYTNISYAGTGLTMEEGADVTISRMVFSSNWRGLEVEGYNTIKMTVNRHNFYHNHTGIYADPAPGSSITNNDFSGNDRAMVIDTNSVIEVSNNSFADNDWVVDEISTNPIWVDAPYLDLSNNWWGSDSEAVAEGMVEDKDDRSDLLNVIVGPVLSSKPENVGAYGS